MKPAQLFKVIKKESIKKWGRIGWENSLIREYCRLESLQCKREIPPATRRNQIMRALKVEGCNLDSALRLATAAGVKITLG